jgi:hypothetical protein
MSCQGDFECAQRDTIDLITAVEAMPSASPSGASVTVVSQLYEQFPAPSEDTPLSADKALVAQDRDVLAQFDFDPMSASQDPTASELEIHSTEQPEIVKVRVQVPDSSDEVELEYRLVQANGEWRIADISYPEGFTLHELLDTFPPE